MESTHRSGSLNGFGGVFQSVLLLVIVVGAFFMGSLWTKVQILEKGGLVANNAAVPSAPGGGQDVPSKAAVVPELAADDHVRGDKNAKLVLLEYSDLECPFCKSFHPTAQKIINEYKGKVKWVYRHYPLSFHANAQKEAEASECVWEQGGDTAFWKFVDAIYERTTSNGTGFALDKLGPLAAEVGVDQAKFQTCLDSDKYAKKVQDQMAQGTKEGITGTPGNIFLRVSDGENKLIPGALPFEQLKGTVEELL